MDPLSQEDCIILEWKLSLLSPVTRAKATRLITVEADVGIPDWMVRGTTSSEMHISRSMMSLYAAGQAIC